MTPDQFREILRAEVPGIVRGIVREELQPLEVRMGGIEMRLDRLEAEVGGLKLSVEHLYGRLDEQGLI